MPSLKYTQYRITSQDAKGGNGQPGDHARAYVSRFQTNKCSSDLFICVKYSMLLEKNANSV